MSDDRPTRAPILPLYEAISMEFAKRELTDDNLAETVARWAK